MGFVKYTQRQRNNILLLITQSFFFEVWKFEVWTKKATDLR